MENLHFVAQSKSLTFSGGGYCRQGREGNEYGEGVEGIGLNLGSDGIRTRASCPTWYHDAESKRGAYRDPRRQSGTKVMACFVV